MSTIFDYLDHVSYDSIYDRPFKELDVLALTELTYLPFDRIVPQGDTTILKSACLMRQICRSDHRFYRDDQHLQ